MWVEEVKCREGPTEVRSENPKSEMGLLAQRGDE